jgi:hypothetical protein
MLCYERTAERRALITKTYKTDYSLKSPHVYFGFYQRNSRKARTCRQQWLAKPLGFHKTLQFTAKMASRNTPALRYQRTCRQKWLSKPLGFHKTLQFTAKVASRNTPALRYQRTCRQKLLSKPLGIHKTL